MIAALLSAVLAAAVQVVPSPQPVYIESGASAQSLNFDLIVENTTDEPLDLDAIQVSVFDRYGKLLLRKLIDGNGTRPSIRTVDVAEVPPHGTALVFNPFERFESNVDLNSLTYDLELSSKDGARRFTASTVVKPQKYQPKAKLILPVAGRLLIYDGHDFYAHHRRWDYTIPGIRQLGFKTNFMRYSYDFVAVDAGGNTTNGKGDENENWLGFGKDVRAVADGTVAAVVDDQPDDRNFDPSSIAEHGTMRIWGNYVVVDHGGGEFSLYGHIRRGSSRVKTGQRVKRGQVVAAIGAAGSSMFPHLHFELQTSPDTNAEGLPSTFHDFYRILGDTRMPVSEGTVDSGEMVESK